MGSKARSAGPIRIGRALAAAGLLLVVGTSTALAAKVDPAITRFTCVETGDSVTSLTTVSWQGFHPSRIEFTWQSTTGAGTATTALTRPKGTSATVDTPSFSGAYIDPMVPSVVIYGPGKQVLSAGLGECDITF